MKITVSTAKKDYEVETTDEISMNAIIAVAKKYEARGTVAGADAAYDIYSQIGLMTSAGRAAKLASKLESEKEDTENSDTETASALK